MALRPCFSAGLLFSDMICEYYNERLALRTFHFSNIDLQDCNHFFYFLGLATINKRPQLAFPLAAIQV
jgi:hypothetical protein